VALAAAVAFAVFAGGAARAAIETDPVAL